MSPVEPPAGSPAPPPPPAAALAGFPTRQIDFGIGRLFWAIRDVVVVADTDTALIALWNPAAEALFGYAAHEVVGLSLELLVPERFRARCREGIARLRETGLDEFLAAHTLRDLVGLCKDGREINVEATFSALDVDWHKPYAASAGHYVVALLRDVTDRKALEAERAERARLDGALLVTRTVAHEINNAIAPVVAFGELLSELPAVANDQQASAYLDRIREAAADTAHRAARLQRIVRVQQAPPIPGLDHPVLDLDRSTSP